MLRIRALFAVAALLLLAVTPAAAGTMQQDFDAAQALLDGGKAEAARDAFTALLARFSSGSKARAAVVVRARLGRALVDYGNPDAAVPLLTAAIAGFAAPTPQDSEEREAARYDLGRAEEGRVNLDTAAGHYRAVLASGIFAHDDPVEIGLRAGLARTLIWSAPDEARRLLDGLLALPKNKLGNTPDTLALIKTLRGRVELNNSNLPNALKWFNEAALAAGGAQTQKVTIADVRIRGDLALANFTLGRMAEVQRFAALSGAGQLLSEGLATASEMPLPACAPLTGLAPDAVAVVEFSIASDGRTFGVTPVYANRGSGGATAAGGGPEILFAQAVRNWSWAPEPLAKLKPFWRQSIRVELRCFTTRTDGNVVFNSIAKDNAGWVSSMGLEPTPAYEGSDAVTLPLLRAEIARRETKYGEQSAQLILPVAALSRNVAAPAAERAAAHARYGDLLAANNAPASAQIFFRMSDIHQSVASVKTPLENLRRLRDGYAALLAEQEAAGTGNTRIAMLTRFQLAEIQDELKSVAASRALLDRIVAADETLLPAGDPIRTAALLRISNQAAAAHDAATAATALAATGLSPEQCALVDVRPQAINAKITATVFPDLAVTWHTGGFARVGYDITADGTTTNIRTVTASPPFIFGPGTERAIARFRYQPVLRPGNTIGCSGSERVQRFRVIDG